MTLTQGIADSLGVADAGLRLILGQLSGTSFKKLTRLWIEFILTIFRISFVSTTSAVFEKKLINNSACILCPEWHGYRLLEHWIGMHWSQLRMHRSMSLFESVLCSYLNVIPLTFQVTWATLKIFHGSLNSTIFMYIFQVLKHGLMFN